MHKTMAREASLEKIDLIRSQEFMPSEARLKFLKKMIILGPKTAILGPQFCRILVLGPHFWWSGGPRLLGPPWICPCYWKGMAKDVKDIQRYLACRQEKARVQSYPLHMTEIPD